MKLFINKKENVMKKEFILFAAAVLFAVPEAQALPRCTAQQTGASYVGSWRKPDGAWELPFSCLNGVSAKVGIEGTVDARQDDGIYFLMKEDGARDGEDFYNDACDAISEYCETALDSEAPSAEGSGEAGEDGSVETGSVFEMTD
jgi:hypothetical protein